MSQSKRLTKISKFLSYVLRHKPEDIGLRLDIHGWVDIEQLMAGHFNKYGTRLEKQDILDVVVTCEKQRYEVTPDHLRIRAVQGHSVEVDPGLMPALPPDVLYHGTASRFLDSIHVSGLSSMSRTHVHLSADYHTAVNVGSRHGLAVVLSIDTARMRADGIKFWLAKNHVWLVDHVDPKYFIKDAQ